MPFLLNALGVEPRHNYTAVIYVQIGAALGPNAALYKLVRTITKSQFVDRVSRQSNVSLVSCVRSQDYWDFLPSSEWEHISYPPLSVSYSHFRYSCCGLPIVHCR